MIYPLKLVLSFYGELTIYDTEIEDNYDVCELIGLKDWRDVVLILL